jgi:hypothetical protein
VDGTIDLLCENEFQTNFEKAQHQGKDTVAIVN